MKFLRGIYDWTLSLAETRYALLALAFVAFIESSVFPIPPHVLMIPMVIAVPKDWWKIALTATVASVIGGMAGYAIGAFFFDTLGAPVLDFYGKMEYFEEFKERFNANGAWAVLFAGMTPFPYKVITITSGVTGLDFTTFSIASVVARGFIFFAVAGLLRLFGPPIREFIEKRFALMVTVFLVLLFGGFMAVRYL